MSRMRLCCRLPGHRLGCFLRLDDCRIALEDILEALWCGVPSLNEGAAGVHELGDLRTQRELGAVTSEWVVKKRVHVQEPLEADIGQNHKEVRKHNSEHVVVDALCRCHEQLCDRVRGNSSARKAVKHLAGCGAAGLTALNLHKASSLVEAGVKQGAEVGCQNPYVAVYDQGDQVHVRVRELGVDVGEDLCTGIDDGGQLVQHSGQALRAVVDPAPGLQLVQHGLRPVVCENVARHAALLRVHNVLPLIHIDKPLSIQVQEGNVACCLLPCP
mmetsp:Transcript_47326/g.119802  ORF Transcript_47326/g.119802 Transcript_47326/m.119802 type:complete len:272 (+) Transcript_47326:702-1517(+)